MSRMLARENPIFRNVIAAAILALLAGCASGGGSSREGRGPDIANPHVKLGKPYVVRGKRYVPRDDPDYNEVGVASWYGDQFHGRKTANGEIFDMWGVSAAHKTLPLPSLVEVENLENRRRITVRVNDRGPFAHNRIIDLSRAAARELGFEGAGLAKVRVRYLGPASMNDAVVALAQPRKRPARPPATPKTPERRDAAPIIVASAPDEASDILRAMAETGPVENVADNAPHPGWVVSVAAVSDLTRALNKLDVIGELDVERRVGAAGAVFYDLRIGPFAAITDAEQALEAVLASGYASARISENDSTVY